MSVLEPSDGAARHPYQVMKFPLEDNFTDVLGKAKRGLKWSDSELARRAGVPEPDLRAVVGGQANETVLRRLAGALGLGADALVQLASGSWSPIDPRPIAGFADFTTPHGELGVNSFLVFDQRTNQAAAFDTGTDCATMLAFAAKHRLQISQIFITHAHQDHVDDLDRLQRSTNATVWVSDRELVAGARTFSDGTEFALGRLSISTRKTSGHARGGVTYVVEGLARRIAIVGDAIFAGSMGGGMVDYREALRTNGESIMSLPHDTVLCPGHGPLTTVREERLNNPFVPAFVVAAASANK